MTKKVKYTGSSVWSCVKLNKIYDVINETFGEVEIIDDDGDECWFTKDNFEIIEERSKTLLEYFMELHDLKDGEEFQMNIYQTKIQDGKLLTSSCFGNLWDVGEFPLHYFNNVEITKNET